MVITLIAMITIMISIVVIMIMIIVHYLFVVIDHWLTRRATYETDKRSKGKAARACACGVRFITYVICVIL